MQRGPFDVLDRWITAWVRNTGLLLDPVPDDAERDAAERFAGEKTHGFLRVATSLLALAMIAFAAIDALALPGATGPYGPADAYLRIRVGVGAICATYVLLGGAPARAPRFAVAVMLASIFAYLANPAMVAHPGHGVLAATMLGLILIHIVMGHVLFLLLLHLYVAGARLEVPVRAATLCGLPAAGYPAGGA